jgi:hypothetical protein
MRVHRLVCLLFDLRLPSHHLWSVLRVEWCKGRARAHRWQEECLLLAEEMRRVIAFFTWQAAWWQDRPLILDISPLSTDARLEARQTANLVVLQEGGVAYADRQARIRDSMRITCEKKWKEMGEQLLNMEEWDAQILVEYTEIS